MSARAEPRLHPSDALTARRLRLKGRVQGVGFRPFVYRLARELALAGTVRNLRGEVEIFVQGSARQVDRFLREVLDRAPPLAAPELLASDRAELEPRQDFTILDSAAGEGAQITVPADQCICAACLGELATPSDRRYRYPFINCTQCGPRYTLIRALPYDRANTTMAAFPLCAACRREYRAPLDRRFHAEPIACPQCGPRVWLEVNASAPYGAGKPPLENESALTHAVELLRNGGILAVKGIGGYHLMCDATDAAAVGRLRARKQRPHKPLAVMFPARGADGLAAVRREAQLADAEAALLNAPTRPIVLLAKRPHTRLAESVAPDLREIGALLPYSPLHQLLLADFGGPLVATSANRSGEPVLTEVAAARAALSCVADAFLHHDRPIIRPADDSLVRVTLGRAMTLRLGRGLAPCELTLPWRLPRPVIAVGGHLKVTIALAFEDRVVISPHVADLGTVRSETVFTQVIEDLQRLYGVTAARVACDAHPNYASSRWAARCGLPVSRIWHHYAHASALAGEYAVEREISRDREMLVFTWDGSGYGADRTLWGGEALLGRAGDWRRVASVRRFRVPGGERAGRAPWRSAAALCWELGRELPDRADAEALVRQAWQHQLNCPATSSVGRLFDAAAALLLGVRETSHEGEGPMMLEAAAAEAGGAALASGTDALPLERDADGVLRFDWSPLVTLLLDQSGPLAVRAARFHGVLAATLCAVACEERARSGVDCVGLTGGVFQNAVLTRLAHQSLAQAGFRVLLAGQIPCNDGGLSFGQVIELAAAAQHGVPTRAMQS